MFPSSILAKPILLQIQVEFLGGYVFLCKRFFERLVFALESDNSCLHILGKILWESSLYYPKRWFLSSSGMLILMLILLVFFFSILLLFFSVLLELEFFHSNIILSNLDNTQRLCLQYSLKIDYQLAISWNLKDWYHSCLYLQTCQRFYILKGYILISIYK